MACGSEREESKRVSQADDLLGLTDNRRSFLMRSLTNSVIDLSKRKHQTEQKTDTKTREEQHKVFLTDQKKVKVIEISSESATK